jgi:hypothetical protein
MAINRFNTVAIIVVSLCCLLDINAAWADEDDSSFDANKYDASEFDVNSFRDRSFFKTDFRDVKPKAFGSARKFESDISIVRRRNDTDINVDSATEGPGAGEKKAFEDFGVIYDLAGDWVPSKIDPACNGGFTNYPGNGSPVPYELNGHVDAERGKP